jgi:hypothetical protein
MYELAILPLLGGDAYEKLPVGVPVQLRPVLYLY